MTSIIKLEVISGAKDDYGPPCYLLQVDEFKFLLDCGIDESLSRSLVTRIAKHVKSIDAVLLSHPDAHHLGALPCLVGKHGLSCPIYCTVPVMKMGEMFMYDLYSSREMREEFTLFTLEDVDLAFSKVTQLKYNQTVNLKGKGAGIRITPLPAGHMIGGTIWRISKDGEEEIIYAVDFNHKRERHLNGCSLESISKPSVLILDSFNANYQQTKRTQRDEELMTTILKTVRKKGNVLVAVDTAGRALELAYMLDQLWTPESGLSAYSLAMLNSVASHVIEFAKSQVEWMSDKVMKSFEDRRNNPFHLKNVNICQDMTSFNNIRQPCVVLATQPDLEAGFSRELFAEWVIGVENAVILTQRCSSLTLASVALGSKLTRVVSVELTKKVPLQGLELEEYKWQQKQKELEKKKAAEAARDDEDDDDDEDEEENIPESGQLDSKGGNKLGNVTRHDLMMARDGGKSRSGSFFKKGKTVYPMFPCPDVRVKFDDYGEFINIDDFKIIDTTLIEAEKEKENAAINDKENTKMEVDEVQEEKIPTKYVTEVKSLPIAAKVSLIDFEGKSDGESLKRIVSIIKPRRLILVKGTTESTASLASYCETVKNEIGLDKVFTPKVGEVVDATTESHIYQAKLKDSLVSSLKFSRARDADLAWVDAEIDMEEATKDMTISQPSAVIGEGKSDGITQDENVEMMPVLKSLPQNMVPGHVTIFVNECKLSHFKQVLLKNRIQAEFSGGVLYCNNKVAVKRNEAGRITLEGTICEDYFVIRELLYQQYAIL